MFQLFVSQATISRRSMSLYLGQDLYVRLVDYTCSPPNVAGADAKNCCLALQAVVVHGTTAVQQYCVRMYQVCIYIRDLIRSSRRGGVFTSHPSVRRRPLFTCDVRIFDFVKDRVEERQNHQVDQRRLGANIRRAVNGDTGQSHSRRPHAVGQSPRQAANVSLQVRLLLFLYLVYSIHLDD